VRAFSAEKVESAENAKFGRGWVSASIINGRKLIGTGEKMGVDSSEIRRSVLPDGSRRKKPERFID
jgi:hypothetical protein